MAKVMSCSVKIVSFSFGSSRAMAREAGPQQDCDMILTVPGPCWVFKNSLIISAAFCVTSIMTLPSRI